MKDVDETCCKIMHFVGVCPDVDKRHDFVYGKFFLDFEALLSRGSFGRFGNEVNSQGSPIVEGALRDDVATTYTSQRYAVLIVGRPICEKPTL